MENNCCTGHSVLFCHYDVDDWHSSTTAQKTYSLEKSAKKTYSFPFLNKCGNTLVICHGKDHADRLSTIIQEILIIKKPGISYASRELLVPSKKIHVDRAGYFVEGQATPNEKYFLVIVADEREDFFQQNQHDARLPSMLTRSHIMILYSMSLCSDPMIFHEIDHVRLPFRMMNKFLGDVYLVNDKYAVIFPTKDDQDPFIFSRTRRMFVYKINNNLKLIYSVDLCELATVFVGEVLAACWCHEDVLVILTSTSVLYQVNLENKKVDLLTTLPDSRQSRQDTYLFYISTPLKQYFCIIQKPFSLRGSVTLNCVTIWLVERNLESFLVQRKALPEYLQSYFSISECFDVIKFFVDPLNGKCSTVMTSLNRDYFVMFTFDLLHPDAPLNVLFEQNKSYIGRTGPDIKTVMTINEKHRSSEILSILYPKSRDDPDLVIQGVVTIKPIISLQNILKIFIKNLYSKDEISSMDIPKMLKHYLLI